MAFLRSENANNTLKGAGGYAGNGTPVGGRPRTAAGQPGNWYNIQDFLNANPQKSNVAPRIEQKAGESMAGAKQQLQSQFNTVQNQTMPTPETYSGDKFSQIRQGGINQGETQDLRRFLDQTPQNFEPGQQLYELAPEQQVRDVRNPFSDMKTGDFSSIMKWYGDIERPSSEYTPGMQKMDEMLLRKSNIGEELPGQMQGRFQSEIIDPIKQKRDQLQAKQADSQKAFEQQRTDWTQGISSFLQGEDAKIKDIYEQQQQAMAEQDAVTTQQIFGNDYENLQWLYPDNAADSGLTLKNVIAGDPRQGSQTDVMGSKYLQRSPVIDPSMNTAALQYYTNPQDLADYNTLIGLLGQGDPRQLEGVEAFDPGEWTYDRKAFSQDWRDKYKEIEQQKIQDTIDAIMNKPPVSHQWGKPIPYVVPENFDTEYGQIINDMEQAGQIIMPQSLEEIRAEEERQRLQKEEEESRRRGDYLGGR